VAPGRWRVNDAPNTVIFREMGYTKREFTRVLPPAMRDWPVSGGPDAWAVSDRTGAGIANIRFSALPERSTGSLSPPVLAVTIDLGNAAPEQATEFMRRFDRGFHRGGG
jgi:hypothetical protein